ncbi:MAG: CocE/NonD family hydrolase [Oceanococcaceae bacterium]
MSRGGGLVVLLLWAWGAQAATLQQDFLALPDGTHLYYSLTLPEGQGPFPVLIQYDPYAAGVTSDPSWTEAGYAMLGVNFRGSGCSEGAFDVGRADIWGRDGADVVAWAAAQPWSDGQVGMFGYSFTGTSQLATAAFAGPALKAIAPGNVFPDFYRDLAYLGGIHNEWVPLWVLAGRAVVVGSDTLAQPLTDPRCTPQLVTQFPPALVQSPNTRLSPDSEAAFWTHNPRAYLDRVQLPVLGCVNWQDTTIYSRAASMFRQSLPAASTWLVGSNGSHSDCPISRARMLRFFDRYLKGEDNGWENTPHLLLIHELDNSQGSGVRESLGDDAGAWQTAFQSWEEWEALVQPLILQLGPEGQLIEGVVEPTSSRSFLPAPESAQTPGDWLSFNRFGLPELPGSSLRWTTPALARDVELLGPASLDLWLSVQGTDADLQATLVEVLPDGREQYVQNGWLRWSHRQLGPESTALEPRHTHREADRQPLQPGEPTLGRVGILPLNHVFRAGSAIRLILDAPGGWMERMPMGPVRIHIGAEQPSRLVLGWLPQAWAQAPAADCGSLLNQPCRSSAEPIPEGFWTPGQPLLGRGSPAAEPGRGGAVSLWLLLWAAWLCSGRRPAARAFSPA